MLLYFDDSFLLLEANECNDAASNAVTINALTFGNEKESKAGTDGTFERLLATYFIFKSGIFCKELSN